MCNRNYWLEKYEYMNRCRNDCLFDSILYNIICNSTWNFINWSFRRINHQEYLKWKEKLQLWFCLSEAIVKSICRQNAKNHLTVKYWRHNKVYWTNADVWHLKGAIHYLGFMWSNKTIEEFSNWIELSPAYIFGRITRTFHASTYLSIIFGQCGT